MTPGQGCPAEHCDGRMVVYATRINFAQKVRVRYLHCGKCGHLPDGNKWIVPLEYAPEKNPKIRTIPSTETLPIKNGNSLTFKHGI